MEGEGGILDQLNDCHLFRRTLFHGVSLLFVSSAKIIVILGSLFALWNSYPGSKTSGNTKWTIIKTTIINSNIVFTKL
jgi:hypothetical protein